MATSTMIFMLVAHRTTGSGILTADDLARARFSRAEGGGQVEWRRLRGPAGRRRLGGLARLADHCSQHTQLASPITSHMKPAPARVQASVRRLGWLACASGRMSEVAR